MVKKERTKIDLFIESKQVFFNFSLLCELKDFLLLLIWSIYKMSAGRKYGEICGYVWNKHIVNYKTNCWTNLTVRLIF